MNTYLVNRMVFLKYARDNREQLAAWMKELLPRIRAFATNYGGGTTSSVMYRSDQPPMDKLTMIGVINRVSSKSLKRPKMTATVTYRHLCQILTCRQGVGEPWVHR